MVTESHRLPDLKMGEAGHDRGAVLFRLCDQRCLKRHDLAVEPVDRVTYPQPEVRRDLIVARARSVQPPRWRADHLGKPRLDIEMDILMLDAEGKFPAL